MAAPLSLVELSDQEPSIGFQHPVHLCDGGRLVVLSDVVQSEGAGHRVEGVVREREVLRERDLEADRGDLSQAGNLATEEHVRLRDRQCKGTGVAASTRWLRRPL